MKEFIIKEETKKTKQIDQAQINELPRNSLEINSLEIQSNDKKLNIIASFFVIISVTFAGIFGYFFVKSEKEKSKEDVKGTITSTTEKSTNDNSFSNSIIFSSNNKLYQKKIDDSKIIEIANFSDNLSVISVNKKSNEIIQILKCQEEKEIRSNCRIDEINLSNKEILTKNKFDTEENIIEIAWGDNFQIFFSYAKNNGKQVLSFYKIDENSQTNLFEIDGIFFDREEFIEDCSRLILSPQNKSFLFIETKLNGFSFTTFIYQFEDENLIKIENSTNPVWLDEKTIIYRKYSNIDQGYLFSYDLSTRKEKKIYQSENSSYNPILLNKLLVYWSFDKIPSIKFINLTNFEKKSILEGYILVKKLNNDLIIVRKEYPCSKSECKEIGSKEYETGFKDGEYYIYNILIDEIYPLELSTSAIKTSIAF